jgi:hypothetical protein
MTVDVTTKCQQSPEHGLTVRSVQYARRLRDTAAPVEVCCGICLPEPFMSPRLRAFTLPGIVALWLAACLALRYGFMEDGRWVGLCADDPLRWQCVLRHTLGLLIHYRVIAWAALFLAVPSCFLRGRPGVWLARAGLFLGLPALVLYTASLAVFAVVPAALRLVRQPSA